MLRGERKLNININYQLVWIIFELLLKHNPEPEECCCQVDKITLP